MRKLLIIIACLAVSPAWAATCKISEYASVKGEIIPVAAEPALATESVTYTTSSQSAAFAERTAFVRIVCDAKAHFVFGTSPTATASSPYVAADTPEYFGVIGGIKVAFYDGSS